MEKRLLGECTDLQRMSELTFRISFRILAKSQTTLVKFSWRHNRLQFTAGESSVGDSQQTTVH